MEDLLIRGIAESGDFRFFGIDATNSVKRAKKIHHLSSTNTLLMGKVIAATYLLSSDLKNKTDVVTFKIDSDGVSGNIICTAKADGTIKSYMRNATKEVYSETKMIDTKTALGKGQLTIIKDMGMKHPYVGSTELITSEIAQDLTYYFAKSEQIPSSVGLGVLTNSEGDVKHAGGFIIQMMPDASENMIEMIEDNMGHFPNLTDMMDMGHSITRLITDFILKDIPVKITEQKKVRYYCGCSKNTFKKGLSLLSTKELKEIIKTEETIKVDCHFCNTTYEYSIEEIKDILKNKK